MADYTSAYTGAQIDLAVGNANLMLLTGATDPDTSTVGRLGQVYQNTTDGTLFRCTVIVDTTYTWTELTDFTAAKIINTLTETGTGKVLDARQGKALSDKIGAQTFTEGNYVTDAASDTANIDALDMAVKDNADLISTNIAEITDIKKVIGKTFVDSWEAVQEIVRQGEADKYFSIGDQFSANYNGTPYAFNVIGIDHDTPTDGAYTHSLTLQPHACLLNGVFDAPEALYYAAAELPAGVQKFAIGATIYEFTTVNALAIGGQIVPSAWTGEVPTQVKTYASATSTDVIETLTVSVSSGDITLTPLNDLGRTHYGSNNYIQSGIKQWLNSADAVFVWEAKTIYDRPLASPNAKGFLNLLDADLVAVLGAVNKQVARSTYEGGGQDTFNDKVFLPSRIEVYGTAEGTVTGESAYEYFSVNAAAPTDAAVAWRIKYWSGEANYWWVRSPNVTLSNSPRIVSTTGDVSYGIPSNSHGLAPCVVIV